MGQEQLAQEIIKRSVAKTWAAARTEWSLATVYFARDPDECLCGQFPIVELCVLTNRLNHAEAIVGNVCVKKFLGLPSDRIFNALKRIRADLSTALNEDAALYAHRRGWINDWERDFCISTRRKRNLTDRQLAKRVQINEKILAHVAGDTRAPRGAR